MLNVASIHVHTDKDGNFISPAVYKIKGTESYGIWRADAVHGQTVEAFCHFEIKQSAIPEFPAGVAGIIVTGICSYIYFRMRKGREAIA